MRMTGALLTAVALCLAGGYAARMLTLRVSLLEKICVMLRIVRTQLECCCCPVGDVLEILVDSGAQRACVYPRVRTALPERTVSAGVERFAFRAGKYSRLGPVRCLASGLLRAFARHYRARGSACKLRYVYIRLRTASVGGAGEEKEIRKDSAASRSTRGRGHRDSGCIKAV